MAKIWRRDDREWAAQAPGYRVMHLHRHTRGGGGLFVQLDPGTKTPARHSPVGEHLFVVRGEATLGDLQLEAGDAVWIEPGQSYELVATTEVVLLSVSPPKRVAVIQNPG